ncbi:MAG TPA: thermonuclease family protein [Xanthobacteraceae bacterium]|jgi:endonuclease YncB( thermonuclease family)|nr:thermonuclease family protein [Xanthobacteraceae bacterium]
MGLNVIATISRRGQMALFGAVCLLGLAAASWVHDRIGPKIIGPAHVVDGDSIVVAGVEIRLYGIDAPELRQSCHRGGRPWACGVEATNVLRTMLAGREVVCRPREQDRYGRTVATCAVSGFDIGSAMVMGGNAVAYGAYELEERQARAARRGLWASSFEQPSAWRASHSR